MTSSEIDEMSENLFQFLSIKNRVVNVVCWPAPPREGRRGLCGQKRETPKENSFLKVQTID